MIGGSAGIGCAVVKLAREFVFQEIERSEHGPRGGSRRAVSLKVLIERVCQVERVRVASVEGGRRRAELCRVREGIA